tara:strand:+ start:52 stop:420 length:369 start_codon:yes stop_codon:yes gene_type:complete
MTQETLQAYFKQRDSEYKDSKKNINFILRGNNKYYYANQCSLFIDHVNRYGFNNISREAIKEHGISFNKYSINNGANQYNTDLKRFNSKEEMFGFVIGFNEAIHSLYKQGKLSNRKEYTTIY